MCCDRKSKAIALHKQIYDASITASNPINKSGQTLSSSFKRLM